MSALDTVNDRYGKGTLRLGSGMLPSNWITAQEPRCWEMKQERRSPQYTTRLGEVLSVS